MSSTHKLGNFQVREIKTGAVIGSYDTLPKAKRLATSQNKLHGKVVFEAVEA